MHPPSDVAVCSAGALSPVPACGAFVPASAGDSVSDVFISVSVLSGHPAICRKAVFCKVSVGYSCKKQKESGIPAFSQRKWSNGVTGVS